jgi:hypothetical protein
MKKVLIVSYYFPPMNRIASKRYGTMCKYMKENGYEPYILTVNSAGDLPIPISEENIIRVGKDSATFLNKNNCTIGLNKTKLTIGQIIMLGIFDRIRLHLRSIDRNSFAWYNEVKSKKNYILNNYDKPDIILGTFDPISNIMIARYLSNIYKVPYIVEIRDLIAQYKDDVPKGYKKSEIIDQYIEKFWFYKASGIVVVTEGYKKILKAIYPNKKIRVVFNGWDRLYKNIYLKDQKNEISKYLYYAGNVYEHRLEAFFLLFDSLKLVNEKIDIKLILRLIASKSTLGKIRKYINCIGASKYIIIKDICSDEIVKREQQTAMINLVLSELDERKPYLLTTIPGKLMELLCEKAPILAIASPKSEISEILKKTNKGMVTNSQEKIVDYILDGHLEYIADNKQISKYSRKKQAKVLCSFLDSVLKK